MATFRLYTLPPSSLKMSLNIKCKTVLVAAPSHSVASTILCSQETSEPARVRSQSDTRGDVERRVEWFHLAAGAGSHTRDVCVPDGQGGYTQQAGVTL
jgi:hypothetical protein